MSSGWIHDDRYSMEGLSMGRRSLNEDRDHNGNSNNDDDDRDDDMMIV